MFDDGYDLAYALAMSEYDQTFEKLNAEINSLLEEKRQLEDKLRLVQRRLDSVMQAAVIMEELDGRTPSISGAIGETVSEKIRHVLLRSDEPMTAQEIRDQLAKYGFTFAGDPRPMATIHSILQRLVTASKPVIGEAPRKNGRKAWRQIAWRQEGKK
jgi:hypothetical protein